MLEVTMFGPRMFSQFLSGWHAKLLKQRGILFGGNKI